MINPTTQIRFDHALEIDQEIEARWTHGGHRWVARAKVVKVNAKSVKAELLEDVSRIYADGWRAGFVLTLPRLAPMTQWSLNNGAFPPQVKIGASQ